MVRKKHATLASMNKLTLIAIMFICGMAVGQSNEDPIEAVSWELNWKTEIGLTSYRTNMLMHDGYLFIASNGEDRSGQVDKMDGVFVLDPANGSVQHHIEGLSISDNDVNGLAISSNNILYFGGDAHYLFAYDLSDYSEQWKYKVPADIEGVPALADLNNDTIHDVIVNVEGVGIWAFDGVTGALIWKKEIGTHNGNVSPVAVDLNADGIEDVVCGGNGYFALDGRNGEVLWSYAKSSGVHGSPLVIAQDDSIQIHFVSSYGDYDILDAKGNPIAGAGLSFGLFSSPCHSGKANYVAMGTSWHSDNNVSSFSTDLANWSWEEEKSKFGPTKSTQYHSTKSNETSATAIALDIDNDSNVEFLIPDENGVLYIIHPEKKQTERYNLPTGAEASLAVFDHNDDGNYELFLAGLDGFLYCYQLTGVKDIVWNSFRGNENNGILLLNGN